MKKTIQVGWCLIPPYIINREDLTQTEKLIYGRILGLTGKNGYCYATNHWLGKQIGVKAKTVANVISFLKKKNLLETKVIRDDEQHITARFIFVRGFPIEGTPLPELGNTPSRIRESIVLDNSVDNSVESTQPVKEDILEEKLRIQRERHLKKGTPLGTPPKSYPTYPTKKEKVYVDAKGIV